MRVKRGLAAPAGPFLGSARNPRAGGRAQPTEPHWPGLPRVLGDATAHPDGVLNGHSAYSAENTSLAVAVDKDTPNLSIFLAVIGGVGVSKGEQTTKTYAQVSGLNTHGAGYQDTESWRLGKLGGKD